MSKESQLDEIERLAQVMADKGETVMYICVERLRSGGVYYEMRRDLEASHQANSEISKHNQELSKDNERLSKALVTFGDHTDGCNKFIYANGNCDCDWTRQQDEAHG